jgi:hypothetical protein
MRTPWHKRVGSGRRAADKKTLAPVGVNRGEGLGGAPGSEKSGTAVHQSSTRQAKPQPWGEESGFAAGWYIDPNGGVKPEFDNRCINNC